MQQCGQNRGHRVIGGSRAGWVGATAHQISRAQPLNLARHADTFSSDALGGKGRQIGRNPAAFAARSAPGRQIDQQDVAIEPGLRRHHQIAGMAPQIGDQRHLRQTSIGQQSRHIGISRGSGGFGQRHPQTAGPVGKV